MNRLGKLTFAMLTIALGACSSGPYEKGRSAADVPSRINVVRVREVLITGTAKPDGDYTREVNPSQNDQEVEALVKANVTSQITNFGYKITDKPPADLDISVYVSYQPERWPLIDRAVFVRCRVYDPGAAAIFTTSAHRENAFGLIGAVVGGSRDDMVSEAAREAIVSAVTEMRKGTKIPKKPVAVSTAPARDSKAGEPVS